MVNQVPGGPVSLPACHSGPALDLRKMSHEWPLIPSVLTSSLYKYKKQHLKKENREEWAQPSSRFRTTQQSKHRVKGIHRSLAATEALPQTRAHIYHIDYGSELRSMLLSIPLTERQQNLMDKMPVSVIQWETSRRVEGLITETLQWPFNRRSTHHMCLIPLRYQRDPTDENTVALQARKVSLKSRYECRSRKESEENKRRLTRQTSCGGRRLLLSDSCGEVQQRQNENKLHQICNKCETVKSFPGWISKTLRHPHRGTEHCLSVCENFRSNFVFAMSCPLQRTHSAHTAGLWRVNPFQCNTKIWTAKLVAVMSSMRQVAWMNMRSSSPL